MKLTSLFHILSEVNGSWKHLRTEALVLHASVMKMIHVVIKHQKRVVTTNTEIRSCEKFSSVFWRWSRPVKTRSTLSNQFLRNSVVALNKFHKMWNSEDFILIKGVNDVSSDQFMIFISLVNSYKMIWSLLNVSGETAACGVHLGLNSVSLAVKEE